MNNFKDFFEIQNCNFNKKILFISPEYALDEDKLNYAGGLGILAGDFLRTADKIGLKIYAFGLKYKKAYTIQSFDDEFNQNTIIQDIDYNDYHQVFHPNFIENKYVLIKINNDILFFKVYLKKLNVIEIYLLEYSHNLRNNLHSITDLLYDGSRMTRLLQEIILGQGSIKVADLLGLKYDILHINEGHASFSLFERINLYKENENLTIEKAIKIVKQTNCFTTHTPVIHGNEEFKNDLIIEILSNSELLRNITLENFLNLGKYKDSEIFSMTAFAIRLSEKVNAVSELHSKTSNKMWKSILKGNRFKPITNGIDINYWINEEIRKLCLRNENPKQKEFYNLKKEIKNKNIEILNENNFFNKSASLVELYKNTKISFNDFVIGFARRFAPYKRADLIFKDLISLKELIDTNNVVFIISGKAHPDDLEGKLIIKNILDTIKNNNLQNNIIFIENYNINIAKILFFVSDLWLNNPIRKMEACGTSGMKAALNGCINLSILDGWWDEAYRKNIGYKIQNRKVNKLDDLTLSNEIHNQIKKIINSDFKNYSVWSNKMYYSFYKILKDFSTERMINDYIINLYS